MTVSVITMIDTSGAQNLHKLRLCSARPQPSESIATSLWPQKKAFPPDRYLFSTDPAPDVSELTLTFWILQPVPTQGCIVAISSRISFAP